MYFQFEREQCSGVTVQREVLFSAELKESCPGPHPDEQMWQQRQKNSLKIKLSTSQIAGIARAWQQQSAFHGYSGGSLLKIKLQQKKPSSWYFQSVFFAWVNPASTHRSLRWNELFMHKVRQYRITAENTVMQIVAMLESPPDPRVSTHWWSWLLRWWTAVILQIADSFVLVTFLKMTLRRLLCPHLAACLFCF